MKINKKGFTLIELLAVVVILLAISIIAISSISAAIERNKAKQNEVKIDVIVTYAKLYYEEYKNSFVENEICITMEDLKEKDMLSDSEIKYADGKEIKGVVKFDDNNNEWKFSKDGSC